MLTCWLEQPLNVAAELICEVCFLYGAIMEAFSCDMGPVSRREQSTTEMASSTVSIKQSYSFDIRECGVNPHGMLHI